MGSNVAQSVRRRASDSGEQRPTASGPAKAVLAVWEPEFSLGQLYNKDLFLLGYTQEIDEFARSILAG